jgi:hypothetical protein
MPRTEKSRANVAEVLKSSGYEVRHCSANAVAEADQETRARFGHRLGLGVHHLIVVRAGIHTRSNRMGRKSRYRQPLRKALPVILDRLESSEWHFVELFCHKVLWPRKETTMRAGGALLALAQEHDLQSETSASTTPRR